MDPTLPPPPPTTHSGGVGGGGIGKETHSSGQKIRLMISYGGHILPKPHDKTLFYAGGETRIISVARTVALSFSSLFSHLAKFIFNGSHNFLLKYQLPYHDLDSLISISSDEDVLNMIDEYDRLSQLSSPTPSRIRFFLFKKEELIPELKSDDDWFVDALKVASSNPVEETSPESVALESIPSFGSTNSSNSPGDKADVVADDLKVVLPSVDSLGSDCSIPSPNFSQQATVYQDASGFLDSKPVCVNLVETESNASDRSPRSDILAHVQVSSYMISKSMDQPQHQAPPPPSPPAYYIHHPAPQNYIAQHFHPSSIPVTYTPVYQTYVQPQQPYQYQVNKPYPIYMVPVGQTQNLYDTSVPQTLTTAQTISTSQPQVPSSPVVVAPQMVYEGYKPVIPAPEYAAKVYGPTAVAAKPANFPPVNQPAQPVTAPSVENTNYISDFEDPLHAQIYKTQPSGLTLPSQLQMLPDSFAQLQVENTKR